MTTSLNYSSIVGSSISSNTITLSLTNTSTQNTRIYQVATTNPTTSYTAVQASHVSTGTTNNALALNPSGGNVGVGTTTPSTTFEVYRNGGVGGTTQMNVTSVAGTGTTTNSSIMNLRIQGAGGGLVDNAISAQYNPSGVGTYSLAFSPMGTTVMTVLGSGNVGIGTTAPGTKLQVVGSGGSGSPLRLITDISGNEVGIGFYRNSDQTIPSTGDLWVMGVNSWGSGDRNFAIGTNNTNAALTILANGRIGIGTTTPDVPLHVAGRIRATAPVYSWTATFSYSSGTPTWNPGNQNAWPFTGNVFFVSIRPSDPTQANSCRGTYIVHHSRGASTGNTYGIITPISTIFYIPSYGIDDTAISFTFNSNLAQTLTISITAIA